MTYRSIISSKLFWDLTYNRFHPIIKSIIQLAVVIIYIYSSIFISPSIIEISDDIVIDSNVFFSVRIHSLPYISFIGEDACSQNPHILQPSVFHRI